MLADKLFCHADHRSGKVLPSCLNVQPLSQKLNHSEGVAYPVSPVFRGTKECSKLQLIARFAVCWPGLAAWDTIVLMAFSKKLAYFFWERIVSYLQNNNTHGIGYRPACDKKMPIKGLQFCVLVLFLSAALPWCPVGTLAQGFADPMQPEGWEATQLLMLRDAEPHLDRVS